MVGTTLLTRQKGNSKTHLMVLLSCVHIVFSAEKKKHLPSCQHVQHHWEQQLHYLKQGSLQPLLFLPTTELSFQKHNVRFLWSTKEFQVVGTFKYQFLQSSKCALKRSKKKHKGLAATKALFILYLECLLAQPAYSLLSFSNCCVMAAELINRCKTYKKKLQQMGEKHLSKRHGTGKFVIWC